MRLKHIKLVGFKSFVDPTTVKLNCDLMGIVGPNGCGKSNVIDAVRWVMGEGSAKHLRGESMADVIFNGSTHRKPVGQASVELCFDNSDGSLGGEYATYTEISIKRSVSRDGVSNYYLNGTRCRRKDILDIFLGTGLGPRSYAIIEQGTISRIVEAKPDELRAYLEEVAGISKYKERRRETENRMRHTEENLARLNDIRIELDGQLQHLNRQAEAAEKYKKYQTELREKTAELAALHWRALDAQSTQCVQAVNEAELAYTAQQTEIHRIDATVEQLRENAHEFTDAEHAVQRDFYRVGSEISRLEQELQHREQRAQQLQRDGENLQAEGELLRQQLQDDRQKADQCQQQLTEQTPECEQAAVAAREAGQQLQSTRSAQQAWEQQWDAFTEANHKAAQKAEVEQTRIQQLEQRIQTLQQQYQRWKTEHEQLSTETLEAELAGLEEQVANKEVAVLAEQTQVQKLQNDFKVARTHLQELQKTHDQEQRSLQQERGTFASLQALQQVALGKQDKESMQWLQNQQFDHAARLAQTLQVSAGWEKAVEIVLGSQLQAICLNDINALQQAWEKLPALNINFMIKNIEQLPTAPNGQLATMAKYVNTDWPVQNVLSRIYCVENVSEALSHLAALQADESIITRDGIWLSKNWVRLARGKDEKSGILGREKELSELQEKIQEHEKCVAQLQIEIEQIQLQLQQLEQQREQSLQQLSRCQSAKQEIQAQRTVKQGKLAQVRERAKQLERDMQAHLQQSEQLDVEVKKSRTEWQQALAHIEQHSLTRTELMQLRDQHRTDYASASELEREKREQYHRLQGQIQAAQTQLQALRNNIERAERQLTQSEQRSQEIAVQQQQNGEPLQTLKTELDEKLHQHRVVEQALTEAREKVTHLENQQRTLTQQRHDVEKSMNDNRDKLEKLRVQRESLAVRGDTYQAQVQEAGFTMETLLAALFEDADATVWQETVARIENRIQRLGPINLAAIDEFAQQTERKTYLDQQWEDLTNALTTLQNAIRKIDQETRDRLRATYDTVNQSFQTLFPKIFSGGSASIELTGEDLLEAGISIIARPPGKRNSTIHLLSGGEKALTAIALVFALFQLNPSPFCMLDEVDAPLDDMNVTRFCRLVKEMAQQVQFIVISHNKITMEMVEQLTGVTMHEPGVSRLVAVDIEEALELAEA